MNIQMLKTLHQKNKIRYLWIGLMALTGMLLYHFLTKPSVTNAPQHPSVLVATPLQKNLETRIDFLSQFAAVNQVEIRAQVGGLLTGIYFKDGDTVQKGDVLFSIDPTPYEIKLNQAKAQLKKANAYLFLANRELIRATLLKKSDAGSTQNVDKRAADQKAAQAAVDEDKELVRDAQFDLDHCTIVAPFTGKMSNHLISIGNLVSGSRAATTPTTLLTTLVSMDPIYLNFDMSETDYLTFNKERAKQADHTFNNKIYIALGDDNNFNRIGTLNFIDNAIDRTSGTIHARAIVSNKDLLLTPGEFGRVRLALSKPQPTLLIPDSAVLPDQSSHLVLTLNQENIVVPKIVEIGDLRDGLRVIRSGLTIDDKVIIDGITHSAPGSMVSPKNVKI